jgi:hypothetical protein
MKLSVVLFLALFIPGQVSRVTSIANESPWRYEYLFLYHQVPTLGGPVFCWDWLGERSPYLWDMVVSCDDAVKRTSLLL